MAVILPPKNSRIEDLLDAFQRIWSQPKLPIDARLFIVGLVWSAAVRQGDEPFPREIYQMCVREEPIHPHDMMEVIEAVHIFVFVDKKLRSSYLWVVVQRTLQYLTKHYQGAIEEYVRRSPQAVAA